jgi:hypothetical protein
LRKRRALVMKGNLRTILFSLAVFLGLTYGTRCHADTYELTADALGLSAGNKGTSFTISPELSLAALTRGPQSGYPTGLSGTIYLAQTDGIGVQNQNGDGSADVSGWGKDKYESLIFEFPAAVDAQQVTIWIRNEFKAPGVELWIAPFSGTVMQVPASSVWEFRHMTAGEGHVNLRELPELSEVGSIVSIIVRTSRKVHFFVNRIDFELSADDDNDGFPADYDCDDTDPSVYPGAPEISNGIDDDCDGDVDEDFDSDGDGVADSLDNCPDVANPNQTDSDEDNVGAACDCDDSNAGVNPGATEVCNGIDDNCDGTVDEGVPTETFYRDQDGDGYGNPNVSTEACSQPDGYVTDNTDCNDNAENIHPGMDETGNFIDDDCDGEVDEYSTYYKDDDDDGFGNPDNSIEGCYGQPWGYASNDADCDDSNPNIYPGGTEICNGLDDNCDGNIDEVQCATYYFDADGDTYGDAENSTEATSQPPGYVDNNTDCDDSNAGVNPGVAETCNEVDDDCNDQVDDGLTMYTFYYDADEDGYGNPSNSIEVCHADLPPGYVTNNLDCGDSSENVNPDATEFCRDLVDNDCNGLADELDPYCQL